MQFFYQRQRIYHPRRQQTIEPGLKDECLNLQFIAKLQSFFMMFILYILLPYVTAVVQIEPKQERMEIKIVNELFRLRNEHKADSAEQYYADTVRVYMKYLRNVPRKMITQSDKSFWKSHPKNKFEITAPVQLTTSAGITIAIVIGKEYLDGTAFQYEKIEIKFDKNKKINSYRGFKWKKQ